METKTVKAYGTESAETPLHRLDIQRRSLLPNDVEIDILEFVTQTFILCIMTGAELFIP